MNLSIDRPSSEQRSEFACEEAFQQPLSDRERAPERYEVDEQVKMEVRDLDLHYGDFHALKNVSLIFPKNQVTALIGPSGCGKSTLLKTLNRMNDLVEGCRIDGLVALDEQDAYRDIAVTDLRRRVGMVFQQPNPFPMSIYDNIAFGPRTHGVKRRDELDEIVEQSLRDAALWEEVKDRLKKSALGLSGGQQQRAWIAMALAQKTGLLFLDEPTTYLDISHQLDILYLLRRLNRENGVTIVMVLHDLNHAIMFSDYLVAIKDGTLHSAGTPQEVITQQALREIFDVEAEVITHPVLNVPVCLPFRITEQNKKTGGSNT